jgi:D-xylose transport system substrate-binding protein
MESRVAGVRRRRRLFGAAAWVLAGWALWGSFGCRRQDKPERIQIGLSMDSLRVERWKRDRDLFTDRARELGADVLVQSADGDAKLQNSQAENLLTQRVAVLVVIPKDGVAAAQIVETAHRQNVKVLAYDRLIRDSDLDLYISFDNERVGYLQAEYLTRVVPRGRYFLLGGAPTDNNAQLLRQGQLRALQPKIDAQDITIVGDQWTDNWDPTVALRHVEQALTANNNRIDAIVASNDGTAGGAIEAVRAQRMAGKVAISGQDADLAACQRIVEGTQTMTVYKPLKPLAHRAAELAVALAKGDAIPTERTLNNGKVEVPAVLLDPVPVDASNVYDVVIQDGFHAVEDVYKNIPRQRWPSGS